MTKLVSRSHLPRSGVTPNKLELPKVGIAYCGLSVAAREDLGVNLRPADQYSLDPLRVPLIG